MPDSTFEKYGCQSCAQKLFYVTVPFLAALVYFREYSKMRSFVEMGSLRDWAHYGVPLGLFSVGFWFQEVSYNRVLKQVTSK